MSQKGFTQDLIGVKFGRLVVISRGPQRGYTASHPEGRVYWLCRCACGNEKSIAAGDLRSRSTRSCGCLQRESRFSEPGQAAFNQVLNKYKQDCKQRKVGFHLSESEFRSLVEKPCFYCGCQPMNVEKKPGGNFAYNGIDRIENAKGYIPCNSLPCCRPCNFMRGSLDIEIFLKRCKTIARLHAG